MRKIFQPRVFLIIVCAFLFAGKVCAQLDGNPENLCRNGFFPRESKTYRLAKITGKPKERIYFYGDEREDCPKNINCRLKSYVVPNDEVIISRKFADFACVWFQPQKGSETVGWIKAANLKSIETNFKPAETDWLGKWSFYGNSIVLSKSRTPGMFDIKGDATWRGLGDNVHIGELDDKAKPSENTLNLGAEERDEYACKVAMQLVGKYLIVADNLNCGGANVTFSGVYRRSAKR
jgi:hypothetical protein